MIETRRRAAASSNRDDKALDHQLAKPMNRGGGHEPSQHRSTRARSRGHPRPRCRPSTRPLTDEDGEVREPTARTSKGCAATRSTGPIQPWPNTSQTRPPSAETTKIHIGFGWRPTSSRASRQAALATTPASNRRCARQVRRGEKAR